MKTCSECNKERRDSYFKKRSDTTICQLCRQKCEHGRQKAQCKECGGCNICEHGKYKAQCKECGGSGFCEHGKRKTYCKECGGSSCCEHGKRRRSCKKCNGNGICEHGRRKQYCKECGGSSLCIHEKQKTQCWKCDGSRMCNNCKMTYKNKKYGNGDFCVSCYISLNPNSEAIKGNRVIAGDIIDDIYVKMYPDFVWESKDKSLPNDCGIGRRPDYFLDLGTHILIMEIDENQHKNYNKQCEVARLNNICEVDFRPTIYIRFNPDSYTDSNGNKIQGMFIAGMNKLKHDEKEIRNRLKVVHQEVLKYTNFENVKEKLKDNLIGQVYLFFDEYDDEVEEI